MAKQRHLRWLSWVVAVLVLANGQARLAGRQEPQPIYGRQTLAKALIAGSPRNRDGSYNMSGTSAICGEIPKYASLTGQAVFVVELSGEQSGTITNITFGSNQLAAGVTKATVFRLSVGVVTAQGGRPPQYVLNTDSQKPGNAGTATLTTVKGVTTLRVVGQNDMNETIDLTVTCG